MSNNLIGPTLRIASKVLKIQRQFSPASRRKHATRKSMMAALYNDIWRQAAENLGGSIESMPGGFQKVSVQGATTFVLGSQVCLDDQLTLKLAGNKPLVYQFLGDTPSIGLPGYCTYTCAAVSKAQEFLESSNGPVVVKPASGTGSGMGVTTGVSSKWQLRRATILAASYCDDLLVEEQIAGESYRLLFLGRVLIDAIHRGAPSIVGDGQHSISELVDMENKHRQQSMGRLATSFVGKDDEMRLSLAGQGLTLHSVPDLGQPVSLKHVINENNASENHRVTDAVHPSFVELGILIAKQLGIDLAGIDIIAPDISRPAESQVFVMNDINTTPGIHHHYLVSEQSPTNNVAEQILKYVFEHDSRNEIELGDS